MDLRRARLAEEGVSRVPVECRFVRADGSAAWFLVTEAQLADDDGAPGGLLLSLSEHDERRRASTTSPAAAGSSSRPAHRPARQLGLGPPWPTP